MSKNSRLKLSREKSGLSQQELADKMPVTRKGNPVTQSYIAQIEKDKGYSLKQAKEFARILNTSAEWLYFGNNTIENDKNQQVDMDSFSDIKPLNQRATYLTNSTFPDKPPNEMWELVNIQSRQIKQLIEQNNGAYQQINLLYNQIELLNNLLQKQHEKIEGH